ncbi:TetR/AcrR family transcriptional regulator [Kaistia sp. K-TC2]|uniref:TetR/AcrR family transcriptional regulator n=2 Tax=Kaistia nematophila TaxID=2994654 RepID=A0A9X3IL34_9HYPH|nr:TetR/AcrR family transcriptional regulator [Kaistia nematophila]MCX5569136.1 TetR/AcrR family transcriptional regulator [Kaistia nematophila]
MHDTYRSVTSSSGSGDEVLESSGDRPAAKASKGRADAPPRAADRIRATVRELFYRQGIRAVGIEEIVERAGVTKPSLYRNFASKDELAAAYMRDYDTEFWGRYDAAVSKHPGDPRAQIMAYLSAISVRAQSADYRGCGMTNAAVEFPDRNNPARLVAVGNKHELRRRLTELARQLGVREPEVLGDGLLLLVEGAYVSGQLFGEGGPARSIAIAAGLMIDASLKT